MNYPFLRLQFFTVGMAVMCPGFLIWEASTIYQQIASRNWPDVPGTVISTVAKPWLDSKNKTKFFGRVVYQYTVADQQYESDLTDLGPGEKREDAQAALKDVNHYRPGEAVRVYYNPADPSVAVLETGIPTIHLILLIGLSVGSVVGVVGSVFVLRSWLRSYLAQKESDRQAAAAIRPLSKAWTGVDMGAPRESFRPKRANIAAGFILGFALILGGVSGAAYLLLRDDPKPVQAMSDWIAKYVIIAGLGLAVPALGVALVVWMKRLISHEVTFCENGLIYQYAGATDVVPWLEIAKITEVFTQESLKVLKVPGGSITNVDRSIVILRNDGKEFYFNVNSIQNLVPFAAQLKDASDRHQLRWEQTFE